MNLNPLPKYLTLLVIAQIIVTATCLVVAANEETPQTDTKEHSPSMNDHNPNTTSKKKANHLIHESSPYLQQHAYNPVNWFPWGEDAFVKSRSENKPIFLSIGYSTCHWCHVMERESFENEEVAAVMNQHFVSIKVDREERPDLDKIYMTATQAMTGSGGWPMSVWLTPDLKPFYTGTYFPPESRWGRPGFKEILERINDTWEGNKDGILNQAEKITEALKKQATLTSPDSTLQLDATPLDLGFEQFKNSYDPDDGGFGRAPKFPRPVTMNFLFRYFARNMASTEKDTNATPSPEQKQARDMALHTLRAMGQGGIFDHLGGGFHRYSVDNRWLVSHFEKMLYDQAQLVTSYLEAYQITQEPFYAEVAQHTCEYVARDMTNQEGAFYSAEDADSEGVEGKFYVWTRDEIESIISDKFKADVFFRYYGVEHGGNWEHDLNVLHVVLPVEQVASLFEKPTQLIEEILQDSYKKLFEARLKRIRPHRDEKILTSWNGLMISAFCHAAQILPKQIISTLSAPPTDTLGIKSNTNSPYLRAASRAAKYILKNHYKNGILTRTESTVAVVDDYAFFANSLLDLYETDFDPRWLSIATELTDTMLKQFYDAEIGGFFITSGNDPSVIVRMKEEYDGAEPSSNSIATQLLLRLGQFTNRNEYHEAAQKTLTVLYPVMQRAPHILPQSLCALDWALGKPKQIIIAGQPDREDTIQMLEAVHKNFRPNKIVMLADGDNRQRDLAKVLPFIETIKPLDDKATAYVCVDYTCKLPTTDIDKMISILDETPPSKQ